MPSLLFNRVGVSVVGLPGTGPVTLGPRLPTNTVINSPPWQTFGDAGVTDGNPVRYLVLDQAAWEYGQGTYSGGVLTRPATAMDGSVSGQKSSTSNLLSLTAQAQVFISAVREDFTIGTVADGDYGNITVSGGGLAWTIDPDTVTYARMQNITATARFLGRFSPSGGDPEEITGTQATTLLDIFTNALKGLAPASGGGTAKFLRADQSWAVPPTGVPDADYGDVTVSASGAIWTVDSIQGFTFTPSDAGIDAVLGWDDSANKYQNLTAADARTAIGAQALDATLTALAAYNTNGLLTQTGADTFAGRTITGTAAQITVANGDGVAGNPVLSLPADILVPTILTVPNVGLHLLDTDASHDLIIKPGSNITADRTLTVTTGDASTTVDFTAVTDEFVLAYDITTNTWRGVAQATGSGDVVGPAGATDLAIARFDGVTGKLIQNSSAYITDNGEVLIGSLLQIFGPAILQVTSNAFNNTLPSFWMTDDDVSAAGIDFVKTRGATAAVNTILQSGDRIMSLNCYGNDGTQYVDAGRISIEVDGTPGVNDMPGRIRFLTTPDSAAASVERMRIDNQGRVTIGSLDTDLTAPTTSGTTRMVVSDANGLLSFTTIPSGGGGTPGGLTTEVQYNLAGAFAGDADFTWVAGTGLTVSQHILLAPAGASPQFVSNGSFPLQILSTANDEGISVLNYSASSNRGMLEFGKSRGASVGTHTIVAADDIIGRIAFSASDGSQFVHAAQIEAYVDGTPGSNDMPGRIIFKMTPDGASSPVECMRIDNQGRVTIGSLDTDLTAPTTSGTTKMVVCDANGLLSSTAISGGSVTPGGLTTQVQYNLAGVFAGDADFNWVAGTGLNVNQHVLIGASGTPQFVQNGSFPLQILSTANDEGIAILNYSASSNRGMLEFGKSRGASIGAHTIVADDDIIGRIAFSASDGSAFIHAAQIEAYVDGTPGSNDMPGRMIFKLTDDGGSSPVERMRIDSSGLVTMFYDLLVDGFAAVGNAPTAQDPSSGGGTHFPLNVGYTYTNAQLEGTIFDFSTGANIRNTGHKTSGDMGQMSGLLVNSDIQVDSGATVRTMQSAHLSTYLNGTGIATSGMQGLTTEATIELDNTTGEIAGYVSGAEFYVTLNTAKTCPYMWGMVAQAYTDAAAVLTEMYGAAVNCSIDGDGSAVDAFCLRLNMNLFGTVTNSYLLHVPVPDLDAGRAITNHYGIWVGDQSDVASATNYNILSVHSGAFVTPAKTIGGNLFQGHSAFGNFSDIDTITFSANDPLNEFTIDYVAALAVNEYVTGGPNMFHTGISVYPSYKPVSSGNFLAGMDFNAFINSDATGDIEQFAGIIGYTVNYGMGNVTIRQYGNYAQAEFWGTGVCEELIAYRCGTVAAANGLTNNAYSLLIEASALSQAVTNHYGVYIQDQSGIGSTRSENIRSLGTSGLNVFEGIVTVGKYVEQAEMTAPAAPPANGVRIYAQDNGAGKTQLMALFASGAAQQIAIQP